MARPRHTVSRFALPTLVALCVFASGLAGAAQREPPPLSPRSTAQPAPQAPLQKQEPRAPESFGERVVYHKLPAPLRPATSVLPDASHLAKSSLSLIKAAFPKRPPPKPVIKSSLYAGAPGTNPLRRTLVLYDNTGPWAWLGEAYAVQAGQLSSHGSSYVLKPVASYAAGDLAAHGGAIYIGSTYDEALPVAFLDDVLAGTRPVIWMNYNIWQLVARHGDFSTQYGFTPLSFDTSAATEVTYKGIGLDRDPLAAAAGLLQVQIDDPVKATVLAEASGDGVPALPWATRSGNLTYIAELPFSYVGPNDRYLAVADLISELADPAGPDRKRALVRIEDVGPDAGPDELRAIADYLFSRGVPFSIAAFPYYRDPNGIYNGGVPIEVKLADRPGVVAALQYMQTRGGTVLMHGYTHQYEDYANPYGGTSADDFEFYRAHVDESDYVIYDGPVEVDSVTWVNGRINSSFAAFQQAGFAKPTIFEAPHYAMSALDYQVVNTVFGKRYDRGLYAAGWCPNGLCGSGTPDYTRIYGQYFPFLVRDVFGTIVIPEHLGNVELEWSNNHPPRLPADILDTAQRTTVVRDGVLSFFFHPYVDLQYLEEVVEGVQDMGYEFVSAQTIMQP